MPSAVPTTRTVNGKTLGQNVTLAASDVGALAKPATPSTDQMVVLKADGTTTTQAIPAASTSPVQVAFYNASDTSWYTQPAGAGTKLSARPAGAVQVQFQGQPATATLPSWATSADLRIDAA